jgi:hypothetical protein
MSGGWNRRCRERGPSKLGRAETHRVAHIANNLIKANDTPVNVATNAGCSDEEHARQQAKPVRFF